MLTFIPYQQMMWIYFLLKTLVLIQQHRVRNHVRELVLIR
jgi:hypothetical protein